MSIKGFSVGGNVERYDYNFLDNLPSEITIDTALSDSSTNPVQNRVVTSAINSANGSISFISGEVDDLKSALTLVSGYGVVVYPIEWIDGGYINRNNGAVANYSGWKYTDFIEIDGVNPIRFTTDETVEGNANDNAFYDNNKQYISFFDMRAGDVAVPENAKYFRLSLETMKTATATAPVVSMTELAPKTVLDYFTDSVSANRMIYNSFSRVTTSASVRIYGAVYLEQGKTYTFRFWFDGAWKNYGSAKLDIARGNISETVFTYTDAILTTGFTFNWAHASGAYNFTLTTGSAAGYTEDEIANGIVVYDAEKPLYEYEQGSVIVSANNAMRLNGYSADDFEKTVNDYSLIAYGDSLTQGAGSSGYNKAYLQQCKTALGAASALHLGYGGSASKAIAFTAGAMSGFIPPNTREFALKYADLTTNINIALNQLNNKQVIIDGAEYVISQSGNTEYSLPDAYIPASIYKPVVVKNSRYTADIYVIWVGTNDGEMKWDIVDAMIAKLPHKKYVVMGLTRLGTDTSVADELKGYEKYGSHYFNTRVQIINNAFGVLGLTPTAEDESAMGAGLMPPSLLSDSTHFNDSGYEAIGKLLAVHIKSLGYDYR